MDIKGVGVEFECSEKNILKFFSWILTGYERYSAMRADPALCFLEKVGMPDEMLLSGDQSVVDGVQDAPER